MKKWVFSLFILFAFQAQAGLLGRSFFIEPFVGYQNEGITLTNLNATSTSSIKSSSPAVGLKLGFRSLLGIDLNLSAESAFGKANISPLSDSVDFRHSLAALQIGINSFGLIKMFIGASFLNEFSVKSSPSTSAFKLMGAAYQAGLQFKLAHFLNLGAQYTLNQYNQINGDAYTSTQDLENYYSKVDAQAYTVYLSTSL